LLKFEHHFFDSLAETKRDLEAPLEVDGAVESLQGGHASVAGAAARVAVLQDGQQGRPAVVVVVAHVQRQVARALEVEAPSSHVVVVGAYNQKANNSLSVGAVIRDSRGPLPFAIFTRTARLLRLGVVICSF